MACTAYCKQHSLEIGREFDHLKLGGRRLQRSARSGLALPGSRRDCAVRAEPCMRVAVSCVMVGYDAEHLRKIQFVGLRKVPTALLSRCARLAHKAGVHVPGRGVPVQTFPASASPDKPRTFEHGAMCAACRGNRRVGPRSSRCRVVCGVLGWCTQCVLGATHSTQAFFPGLIF